MKLLLASVKKLLNIDSGANDELNIGEINLRDSSFSIRYIYLCFILSFMPCLSFTFLLSNKCICVV